MSKVAVIGAGVVGQSMIKLFPEAVVYDEPKGVGKRSMVNGCNVAFVCVPTPNRADGALDMTIINDVVSWCECDLIIIRSALQPGTADKLEKMGKNIVVQPEYLGEGVAPPLQDESKTPFMIIGGHPNNRRKAINLYQGVYNANIRIRQVTNLEAEVIKLTENRAILFRVLEAQELYDVCEASGVDYYTIRESVYGDDPRMGLYWTFVYPAKRGANSKCIPKDPKAWAAWSESVGYEAEITKFLIERNERWINTT